MSTLKSPVSEQDHVQGPATAKITLVEYGDYECPHCATAYPIAQRVEKHYGNDLRFVFRNFPLNQIHPYAESAAESAEFAAAHGKFWQMHDALFENQDRLGDDLYAELAQQLGLNPGDLAQALSDGTYTAHVRSDFTRRRPQRRQRHSHVLHQRNPPRRLFRLRNPRRRHRSRSSIRQALTFAPRKEESRSGYSPPQPSVLL